MPLVRKVESMPMWLSAFGLNIARAVAKGRRGKRSRGAAQSSRRDSRQHIRAPSRTPCTDEAATQPFGLL